MRRPDINWSYVARAIDFYQGAGFKYVEVPWIVQPEAVKATLPPDKAGYTTELGALVGSAEQSFIDMMMNGQYLPDAAVAASPCFRDDDVDQFHQPYFFKVELFKRVKDLFSDTLDIAHLAQRFFASLGQPTVILPTGPACFDIMLNGVEIGSYGVRMFSDDPDLRGQRWIYATGLAEPRFSQCTKIVP